MRVFKRNIVFILIIGIFITTIMDVNNIYGNSIMNIFQENFDEASRDIATFSNADYYNVNTHAEDYQVYNIRPTSIVFKNGSFEVPRGSNAFFHGQSYIGEGTRTIDDPSIEWWYIPAWNADEQIKENGYIPGWNSRYLDNAGDYLEFENFIEVRRDRRSYNNENNSQYIELYSSKQNYVYQIFDTKPLSRLIYSYRYATRNRADKGLAVYLKAPDKERMTERIEEAEDYWQEAAGVYIVPEGQYQTEIGFASSQNIISDFSGIIIDDVDVKSGAYIEIEDIADNDKADINYANKGDTINYSLMLTNYGQVAASNIRLKEYLPDGVEYIGNVKVDGHPVEAVAEIGVDGYLTIDFENLINIAENKSVIISYDININHDIAANILKRQVNINYNDKDYEYLHSGGYNTLSKETTVYLFDAVQEDSLDISVFWKDIAIEDIPQEIYVELHKSGYKYGSSIKLSAQNSWKHTWDNIGALSTGTWKVKLSSGFNERFEITVKELMPRRWVVIGGLKDSKSISDHTYSKYYNESAVFVEKKNSGLNIALISDKNENDVAEGETYQYNIILKNQGDEDIQGIWLRCYVPDYTKYDSSDELSDYGCIDKREHATWFIESLKKGEIKKLKLTVTKDYCVAGEIKPELYYEILNSGIKPYSNDKVNPNKVFTN